MLILPLAGWLTLRAPVDGPMLLIPLTTAPGSAVRFAVTVHVPLLRMGPVPGSIVVKASRAALERRALAAGLLPLAGAFACSAAPEHGA